MTTPSSITGDEHRLNLMHQARQWLTTPAGQSLLHKEQEALAIALNNSFGSYLVHYGPIPGELPPCRQIRHSLRLGPPAADIDIYCEEDAWPLGVGAVDVVVLQHALDFSLSPYTLLREAARSIRPGGHLIILGLNPWSLLGASRFLSGHNTPPRQTAAIRVGRAQDWLSLLGFSLEKRQYGHVRWHSSWGSKLYVVGQQLQIPIGGFYLLMGRKLSVSARTLQRQRGEHLGQLIALPVAKVHLTGVTRPEKD